VIEVRSITGRAAVAGFAFAILLACLCYRPALSGAFQLDDVSNLGGLELVNDFDSALNFISSGGAGPLSRPIALLSFTLQSDSWPQDVAAFLKVNILIHLLNAVLVAFLLLRIAMSMRIETGKSMVIAALSAAGWVLMPLLATESLLVVQRMTTLSATFMLLGLIAYLLARSRIDDRPNLALPGMSASLIVATILASLCKESGLLLPVFALVLEATVLPKPERLDTKRWRVWRFVFLVAPLLMLLAYLATRWSYPESLVLRRGFDASERLLTEAQLLWVYLCKAVLGLPGRLGVYQDTPDVVRGALQPLALVASLAWLLLLAAAICWRRRYPLVALAVLWYLGGHLLESTIVPVELYFEHRNYFPIIGPVFALCCAIVLLHEARKQLVAGLALAAVVLFNAGCLYVFASHSGSPSAASRYWAMQYPDSVRAVTRMASYQLSEEGPIRALQTIDAFVLRHPEHAYLRLQELNILCRFRPDLDRDAVLRQLGKELPAADFTLTAGTMLSQLFDTSIASDCANVRPETVAALANVLRSNPRYASEPTYNQFHEKLLAGIARYQGDVAAAIEHLRAAIGFVPSSELNMMMVTALASRGTFDDAREFIDDAMAAGPIHPVRALQWRRDLRGLQNYIDELERVQQ
jgi:hypothetical protein